MIAAGLCMMGGCFALEGGKTVESYWPAEIAVFTETVSASHLVVLTFFFNGGDSLNDVAIWDGCFAASGKAAEWTAATGINRPPSMQTGRMYVIYGSSDARIAVDYGNTRAVITKIQGDSRQISVAAREGNAVVTVDAAEFASLADVYSIPDDVSRQFYVRSVTTTALKYYYYQNQRTGVRFCVRALQAPSGAAALYSDFDETLAEV